MEERVAPVISNIADSLGALGYSPTDSLVLAYFLLHPSDVTSRDVERATWLRQPQVSLSISSLVDKKWIKKTSETSVPVGHPIMNYALRCNPEELCGRLRDAILNEMELKITMLDKVGHLIHNPDEVLSDEAC